MGVINLKLITAHTLPTPPVCLSSWTVSGIPASAVRAQCRDRRVQQVDTMQIEQSAWCCWLFYNQKLIISAETAVSWRGKKLVNLPMVELGSRLQNKLACLCPVWQSGVQKLRMLKEVVSSWICLSFSLRRFGSRLKVFITSDWLVSWPCPTHQPAWTFLCLFTTLPPSLVFVFNVTLQCIW